MPESMHSDPFSPSQTADRIRSLGVSKATMSTLQTISLALIAGGFISFGAMYYTVVMTDAGDAFGPARMLGGISFSLGFILVIIAGAELFTGNNLIVMAWAAKMVSGKAIARNWLLVYFSNMVGAFFAVGLIYFSGFLLDGHYAVGATAIDIALHKVDHSAIEAFTRGIFCNALVCLASWMCYAARSVTDKILAIVFPVSAFVAMGFEHCIANMFMIPLGLIASKNSHIVEVSGYSSEQLTNLTVSGFIENLVPVTIGNIIGGAVMVALVYYFIYLRGQGEGM